MLCDLNDIVWSYCAESFFKKVQYLLSCLNCLPTVFSFSSFSGGDPNCTIESAGLLEIPWEMPFNVHSTLESFSWGCKV
jgi:hypothetical protein